MPKRAETRQQKYENAGKRPGTPIGTRLSDDEDLKLQKRMEEEGISSRSFWLRALIRRELGYNAPPPAPKKKLAGKGNRK